MDFDRFIDQAWDDHATDAAGVADRLAADGPALLHEDAQVARLAALVHHVYGEHLARWEDGRVLLQRLASASGSADSAAALRRCDASLALSAGLADERAALSASDAIRVGAMAAANLAEHDTPRARALFDEALGAASALADTDPAHRALAVSANNLACTLEEKSARSMAERELMIRAAQAARHHWALAGGWLETERAEYRLAMTWLQAGDPAQATRHAQACLQIVQQHEAPALERFFAFEAMGLTAQAAGDAALKADALAQARIAFDALDEADRGWCRSSLDKLAA